MLPLRISQISLAHKITPHNNSKFNTFKTPLKPFVGTLKKLTESIIDKRHLLILVSLTNHNHGMYCNHPHESTFEKIFVGDKRTGVPSQQN